ncbi:putative basic amino acid antiporter YfcC [candidate division KSB1 bacterium]|nr:putative basic amino acid antiporter YfcC [candidate division KSB1 bacterium]
MDAKIKLPHTLILIFGVMIGVAMFTWIIPGGEYERAINAQGREVVVDGTFEPTAGNPQGIFDLLQSPLQGLVETAHIIGFIFILGGVFNIIQRTEMIDAGILVISNALQGRESLIIPAGMILFALFGAIFGMSEEVIPFVLIFIPMAIALGYDSLIGVAIPFLGAGLGFAGAMLNPFTVGIAQGIAELPLFSGIVYRSIVWLIIVSIGIFLVMLYAKRIRKDPKKSPVWDLDQKRRDILNDEKQREIKFTIRHRWILMAFISAILVMIYGVMRYQWFISEIAAIFLGLGIVVALISRLSANESANSFVRGAQDMIGAALVIGFARAILVLATQGQIIDTIMYHLSNTISGMPTIMAAQLMFIMQTFINFFVPSGSGQAALTMPIMAPLSDLIGVSRQTAVLAFQMGDGFTNMIIPTSGVTMGVLGMAKIPWETWAKWLLPIEIILFITGLILLVPPVLFGWGPF